MNTHTHTHMLAAVWVRINLDDVEKSTQRRVHEWNSDNDPLRFETSSAMTRTWNSQNVTFLLTELFSLWKGLEEQIRRLLRDNLYFFLCFWNSFGKLLWSLLKFGHIISVNGDVRKTEAQKWVKEAVKWRLNPPVEMLVYVRIPDPLQW